MRHLFAFMFALLAVTPALADSYPAGSYARSPELCQKAASEGVEAVAGEGELFLTERGLEGLESNCQFLRVDGRDNLPGWVATALCEEPGFAFPDLFSLMPRGENVLEVTSLRDGGTESEGGIGGLYHLCDGVNIR